MLLEFRSLSEAMIGSICDRSRRSKRVPKTLFFQLNQFFRSMKTSAGEQIKKANSYFASSLTSLSGCTAFNLNSSKKSTGEPRNSRSVGPLLTEVNCRKLCGSNGHSVRE